MVKDNWEDDDDFTSDDENNIAAAVNSLFNLDRVPDCLQSLPRNLTTNDVPTTSGSMHLAYCSAPSNFTVTTIHTYCGGTAASGLTKCRFGIYTVDEDGTLTLIASTPNDATLFGSTFAGVSKTLSASHAITEGNIYAIGGLFIASTTAPNIGGSYVNQSEAAVAPRLNGIVNSLTDLPSSVTIEDIAQDYRIPYFRAS